MWYNLYIFVIGIYITYIIICRIFCCVILVYMYYLLLLPLPNTTVYLIVQWFIKTQLHLFLLKLAGARNDKLPTKYVIKRKYFIIKIGVKMCFSWRDDPPTCCSIFVDITRRFGDNILIWGEDVSLIGSPLLLVILEHVRLLPNLIRTQFVNVFYLGCDWIQIVPLPSVTRSVTNSNRN